MRQVTADIHDSLRNRLSWEELFCHVLSFPSWLQICGEKGQMQGRMPGKRYGMYPSLRYGTIPWTAFTAFAALIATDPNLDGIV